MNKRKHLDKSHNTATISIKTKLKLLAIFIIAEIIVYLGSLTRYSDLIFNKTLAITIVLMLLVFDLSLPDSFFKELGRRIKGLFKN